MEIYVFMMIVLTHWVADFVFQAEVWANGKSKDNSKLIAHTVTYSVVWMASLLIFKGFFELSFQGISLFVLVTLLAHTSTDYITSRIVSKQFKKKHFGSGIPNFGAFTTIGFDQVLHYIQLIATWNIIFN